MLGKGNELTGFVNIGKEHTYIHEAQFGSSDKRLANHVLQFIFNELKTFRWPLSHYPTMGALAPEMSEVMWDNIRELLVRGATVIYICFVGAVANRNLMHMLCTNTHQGKPLPFTMINILQPHELIAVIDDPKHLIKK